MITPELPILVWPTTAVCTSYLTGEQADCLLPSTPTDWLGPASEDFDGFVAGRRGVRTRWNVPSTILVRLGRALLGHACHPTPADRPSRRSWRSYRVFTSSPLGGVRAMPPGCLPSDSSNARTSASIGYCSPVTPATRRLTASYSPTAGSPRAEPPAKTASGSLCRIVDSRTRQPTECPACRPPTGHAYRGRCGRF